MAAGGTPTQIGVRCAPAREVVLGARENDWSVGRKSTSFECDYNAPKQDRDMDVDRDALIQTLGGEAAVAKMDHEARADAIEDFMSDKLDAEILARKGNKTYPTVAELEERIGTRDYRRGVGKLFRATPERIGFDELLSGVKVDRLPPMPAKPTLFDFFELRFKPAGHLLQSAALAKRNGASEEVILACLLHDI